MQVTHTKSVDKVQKIGDVPEVVGGPESSRVMAVAVAVSAVVA